MSIDVAMEQPLHPHVGPPRAPSYHSPVFFCGAPSGLPGPTTGRPRSRPTVAADARPTRPPRPPSAVSPLLPARPASELTVTRRDWDLTIPGYRSGIA